MAGWDFKRVLTSRGANLLATLLLSPSVSDLTGSFRLYKRAVLQDLMLSVKGRAYVFQMEVSVACSVLHVCMLCVIVQSGMIDVNSDPPYFANVQLTISFSYLIIN